MAGSIGFAYKLPVFRNMGLFDLFDAACFQPIDNFTNRAVIVKLPMNPDLSVTMNLL